MGRGTVINGIGTQRLAHVRWLVVILGGLALVVGLIVPRPVARAAQTAPPRAGLVVRFGDGSTRTACVELGANGEASGEQVLRDSGLSIILAYTQGMGSLVCKIEQEGCPKEDCLCQCKNLGQNCRYWAYYHLGAAGWEYSNVGVGGYTVRAGAVEGLAWGPGGMGSGVEPPPISFGEVCALPATETPTPTPSPSPTATASPSPTAVPTATAAPASAAPQPIIMPVASSTPSATPSITATRPATATATERASPTVAPASATPEPSATLEPSATPEPPSATPEPPSPTPAPVAVLVNATSVALPTPEAAGGSAATATAGPLWLPLVMRAAPAATPEPMASPAASRVGVSPTAVISDTPTSGNATTANGFFWFLALSGALALALVAVRIRRGG